MVNASHVLGRHGQMSIVNTTARFNLSSVWVLSQENQQLRSSIKSKPSFNIHPQFDTYNLNIDY